MAGIFDDFPLEFRGVDYTIPADRRMKAIATVEEVITLPELVMLCERGSAPTARLATAYGALLRYAGAKVTDEDVYAGMFDGGDFVGEAITALQGLMSLMVPPSAAQADDAEKKTDTPPAKRSSSKGSTRRSSGKAGSRRASSGQ